MKEGSWCLSDTMSRNTDDAIRAACVRPRTAALHSRTRGFASEGRCSKQPRLDSTRPSSIGSGPCALRWCEVWALLTGSRRSPSTQHPDLAANSTRSRWGGGERPPAGTGKYMSLRCCGQCQLSGRIESGRGSDAINVVVADHAFRCTACLGPVRPSGLFFLRRRDGLARGLQEPARNSSSGGASLLPRRVADADADAGNTWVSQ